METVGIRELKNHLSRCIRRVRSGETIQASPGLRELVRRGVARGMVRNDPSQYRTSERVLARGTAQGLLDWDRGDR